MNTIIASVCEYLQMENGKASSLMLCACNNIQPAVQFYIVDSYVWLTALLIFTDLWYGNNIDTGMLIVSTGICQ